MIRSFERRRVTAMTRATWSALAAVAVFSACGSQGESSSTPSGDAGSNASEGGMHSTDIDAAAMDSPDAPTPAHACIAADAGDAGGLSLWEEITPAGATLA